ENHSFNNLLGRLCVRDSRCVGTTRGRLHTGASLGLPAAADVPPEMGHGSGVQTTVVDGGRMDGWDTLSKCDRRTHSAGHKAYAPDQIPNLAALARPSGTSDHTFESDLVPTLGS